jgi:hypothetical protein
MSEEKGLIGDEFFLDWSIERSWLREPQPSFELID